MSAALALAAGGLFAAGVYLLLDRALMRVVLGVVLLGHSANLVLLMAGGSGGEPPKAGTVAAEQAADPLPQAMALTAIVITFGITALLLALAYRASTLTGDDAVQDAVEDRHVAPDRAAP